MSANPQLTLPEKPKQQKKSLKIINWNIILVSLQVTIIVLLLYPSTQLKAKESSFQENPKLLKKTAITLEELGINIQAAKLWQNYLSQTKQKKSEQAAIYFRIGKLYQKSAQYLYALDFYHRAKQAGMDDQVDIKERIVECLENAQRYQAMDSVLREYTNINKSATKKSPIIAKLGTREITDNDLDQAIEKQITAQLQIVPANYQQQFKQQLKKRFQTPEGRKQALQEYLAQEVLWRDALKRKLEKSPDYIEQLKILRKKLLTEEVIRKELTQVVILPEEIQSYYKARKTEYSTIPKASLWVASSKSRKDLQKTISSVKTEEEFKKLLSQQPTTIEVTPQTKELSGFGKAKPIIQSVFKKSQPGLISQVFQIEQKFIAIWIKDHQPTRLKPLREVQQQISQKIQEQKSRQLMQNFIQKLFTQHKVEIYNTKNEENQ